VEENGSLDEYEATIDKLHERHSPQDDVGKNDAGEVTLLNIYKCRSVIIT